MHDARCICTEGCTRRELGGVKLYDRRSIQRCGSKKTKR